MSIDRKIWDPKEWEKYALHLISYHHGLNNVHEVPDEHKGDYGLEAFSTDGIAYQMYAAEEPISTRELYERQREKMRRDIKKFIENKDDLIRLFGNIIIKRWVLLVPRHKSSELTKYAANKTDEVLSCDLPYVDKNFQIMIKEEENYEAEKKALIEAGVHLLNIEVDGISDKVLEDFEEKNDKEIENIERKINKSYQIEEDKLNKLKEMFVREYISGNNVYDKLHADYPEIWEEIKNIKKRREDLLLIEALDEKLTIKSEKEKIHSMISELNKLHENSIEHLAYEAVADWIMRCPLDFRED